MTVVEYNSQRIALTKRLEIGPKYSLSIIPRGQIRRCQCHGCSQCSTDEICERKAILFREFCEACSKHQ